MKYRLFLFDLDDTLLDFRASERAAFAWVLEQAGLQGSADPMPDDTMFRDYQRINQALWLGLEQGRVDKETLKVERFRQTFERHAIDLDPVLASHRYLEALAESVVLVDGARAACEALAAHGELGIITNGIEQVQQRRIARSGLGDLLRFVATSEAAGFAKPDVRFFGHATAMATSFAHGTTVIIGDRLEADVLGANRFGIDSCWYNPDCLPNAGQAVPTHEASSLHQLHPLLSH